MDVVPDDYALSIGHAILALNTADAEVFGLRRATAITICALLI